VHSILEPQIPEKSGDVLNWRGLHGSATSYALAKLAENLALSNDPAPIIYICSETQNVQQVEKELGFYLDPQIPVLSFPDWECLPYDRVSPHADIVSRRLLALHKLPSLSSGILIIPISALMYRLCPTNYVDAHTFDLTIGDNLDTDKFRLRLTDAGYYSVDQVISPGEFAIRGGLIDVYPAGTESPFRIDLFDTSIESIRLFNPETQRSEGTLSHIRILPAREFPLDKASIELFRQSFRATIEGNAKESLIYREISKGLSPTGSEFYLPLFFEQTATLFNYLKDNSVFVLEEGVIENTESLQIEIQERFKNAQLNPEWPPLKPDKLFLNVDDIYSGLKKHRRVQILNLNLKSNKHVLEYDTQTPVRFNLNPRSDIPYQELIEYCTNSKNRILLIAESAGRRESLLGILREYKTTCQRINDWQEFLAHNGQLCLTATDIDRGLVINSERLEVISESQLYGERSFQRRRRSDKNRDPDAIIKSLAELNIGDPVVHEDHGVGRYRGLETLEINDSENEFVTIEYQEGDKIYIPVLSLHLVSRYVGGSPDTAPLHKMGSEQWQKVRKKAKEKAYDVAAELLEVQALRLARRGHAFPQTDHSYDAFSAGFAFDETPDQLEVINAVIDDMTQQKPMDRLVCGDVGFGKTEIALRAAFMAISGNKQVVMLVPTTLLAQQHFNTFADRFADWPVNIELLSRFRTAKETKKALAGLKNGSVDIAVGTHKLIQKGVEFKNLGLMIIDEEHRFGVRQKEQLKKLRSQVDILTLTATPIPRTLNFALSGLRDISVIGTPPKARLSVKTFVREWDDGLLKEAMIREIRRGGQIYFLHNEIQTIEKTMARIQDLVPEARIRIGHGQMNERELESVMRDFYHQRFNVLLCTTIIESGIDVPTANTIIINRANRFGLAQLHQLRGRVGRSHHQAYAYMIVPGLTSMTSNAQKRLTAIESLNTLGAGFALASQDLEIRGAGELLGESQSGSIDQIGYSMYSKFLEQAISDIKRKQQIKRGEKPSNNLKQEKIDIDLSIPARFPNSYIPDVSLRLTMYKRIAGAINRDQLHEIRIEAIDRFGLLPSSAKNLFDIAEIQLRAAGFDIKSLDLGPTGGLIRFVKNPNINIDRLMFTVASNPKEYRFNGTESIQLTRSMPTAEDRFSMIEQFFNIIADD